MRFDGPSIQGLSNGVCHFAPAKMPGLFFSPKLLFAKAQKAKARIA